MQVDDDDDDDNDDNNHFVRDKLHSNVLYYKVTYT